MPELSTVQIDLAARAIHDLHPWLYGETLDGEEVYKPWEEAPATVKDYYRDEAIAALTAATDLLDA